MSRYNDMQFLIAVIGAMQNMRGNIEYIEQELPTIGSPSKRQVEEQCRQFNSFLDEAKEALDALLKELSQLTASAEKSAVAEAIEGLKNFMYSFSRPLSELHELANDLKNLPPEESVLFVLVAESATNITRAEKEIHNSIENTIERLAQRTQRL